MERTRVINHLIEHYIARDRFRLLAEQKLMYAGLPYSTSFIGRLGADKEINEHNVILTRKSLARCKPTTLDYLHALLHDDFMLSEDEHHHVDEDVFRFIIEEEECPTEHSALLAILN